MILVVCATELELHPLLERIDAADKQWLSLVTGVGVVETTLALTSFLLEQGARFDAVFNFGVAGAYLAASGDGAELLDICVAEQELFADFGICHGDHYEALPSHLACKSSYSLDALLLERCLGILQEKNIPCKRGRFLTVAGVSATTERGKMLNRQYEALCENMEGAAVARVCEEFSIPLLEMRCISNFVEDRNLSRWKLNEACCRAADVAAGILQELNRQ